MRISQPVRIVIGLAAVTAAAGASLADPLRTSARQQLSPTYNADIAPILDSHCVSCHQPGTAAPFSLQTYADARARAASIARQVRARAMPPWKPADGAGGPFVGERRLTDRQIQTVLAWAADGAPEGEPAAKAMRTSAPIWRLGTPDIVVTLTEPFPLAAEGADTFRNFVVAIPLASARYVSGVEFQPDSPAIHHANLRFDRTPAARELDARDAAAGYDGPAGVTARYPEGYILGWTPGQSPAVSSKGMAWRLERGTDLVLQLHLRATGRRERVQPRIGFFFTDEAPTGSPVAVRLGQQRIDIAAGQRSVTHDSFELPVDVTVLSIHPHAHGRATTVSAWSDLPDGRRVPLIRIDDWDFNWQDIYRYVSPPRLVRGSIIHVEFTYDNSVSNPRNPDRPPRRVLYGQNSSDEMGDLWLQLITLTTAERSRLLADAVPKALAEDTVGYEMLLRADPDNLSLKQGKAATHYNLGSLLASQRRLDDAVTEFEKAIALRPEHSETYNNLGVVLKAQGRLDAAIESFRRALAVDAKNRAARDNLDAALLLKKQLR